MHNSNQTVSDAGEFNLINRIKNILPDAKNDNLLVPIGDDTAVIKLDRNRVLLATCDIQIEDQHFQLDFISPYQLGRRAAAVNLSDIAAMGGTPTYALISLGLPVNFPVSSFEKLFEGIKDQLADFSTLIVGGNLARSGNKLILDITLLGEAPAGSYLTRSGAKVGDRIFISGKIGMSGAGLHLLNEYGKTSPPGFENLIDKHLLPFPEIALGKKIAGSNLATAMIDISDGFVSDLNHICEMSQVGAEIHQEKLPFPKAFGEFEKLTGKKYLEFALHAGEDYELLFTVKQEVPIHILEKISRETKTAITEVGRITPKDKGLSLIKTNQQKMKLQPEGWDHFAI